MTWYLWAHERTRSVDGSTFYQHVGTKWWVELHGLPDPVVSVMVTEDPDGQYWAWQDKGKEAEKPTMIQPAKPMFDICFAYGPDVEVERGRGRIVRLSIKRWLHGENLK